jgi:hypothetical protein
MQAKGRYCNLRTSDMCRKSHTGECAITALTSVGGLWKQVTSRSLSVELTDTEYHLSVVAAYLGGNVCSKDDDRNL